MLIDILYMDYTSITSGNRFINSQNDIMVLKKTITVVLTLKSRVITVISVQCSKYQSEKIQPSAGKQQE